MGLGKFILDQFTIDKSKIRKIYNNVLKETKNTITILNDDSNAEDLLASRKMTIEQLNVSVDKLNENIQSLMDNSEWNTYTIGFYGETNAGKSTLIEVLRILFNEQSKIIERKAFEEVFAEYNDLSNEIKKNDLESAKLDDSYNVCISEINNNIAILKQHILEFEAEIDKINNAKIDSETKMGEYKKTFLTIIINSILIIKEFIIISKYQNCISTLEEKRMYEYVEIEKQQIELNKIQQNYDLGKIKLHSQKESLIDRRNVLFNKLLNLQDGKIIGKGSSDFTLKCETYNFQNNKMNYSLLDLPGIEGKETIVIDEIKKGLEKSHLIFYISDTCHPPQKGDENSLGTLEKIKEQLSKQTEVYFIYNKRINNVRNLKENLITEEEELSLISVDTVMKEILQDNYRGHLSLSAYPAFLSVANIWDERNIKVKDKFFDKYTKEEILNLSQIDNLMKWLDTDVLQNCKTKIWKSNYNKINVCILDMVESICNVKNNYLSLKKLSSEEYQNITIELTKIKNNYTNKIKKEWYTIVDKFISDTRKEIYLKIDKHISNSDFENEFKQLLEKNRKALRKDIKNSANNEIGNFKVDVEKIVIKFEKYMNDLFEYQQRNQQYNFKFKLTININNNLNITETIFELIGICACVILGGMNMISLIGGAISVVIVLGKAAIAFFNHNYRASEQKKSVNQNLTTIEKNIKDDLEKEHTKLVNDLNIYFNQMQTELYRYIRNQQEVINVLEKAENNLINISKDIEIAGGI